MHTLGGSPYIDLRVDFNSFLPKDLKSNNSNKYINLFLKKINKDQDLHDKIEFNIIPTCYDFNLKSERIFSREYIIKLKKLTLNLFKNRNQVIQNEKNKIFTLNNLINKIKNMKISEIQKIFFLIHHTKFNGTLPFAGLARFAFINTKIIYSLKQINLIDENELNNIFSNIKSISTSISNDYKKLLKKKIKKKDFFNKYGHLRPSTYSISSLNFEEGFKYYFNKKIINQNNSQKKLHVEKLKNYKKIDKMFLKEFKINFKSFYKFFLETVEIREYSKYIFTKGINEIFKNLIKLGKEIDVDRNDLEFLDIQTIIQANNKLNITKYKKLVKQNIKNNKKDFTILSKIKMPDFITDENSVVNFSLKNQRGNFITKKIIFARPKYLDNKKKQNLNNRIVFIDSADPGYDYIFNHNIKGLVTKYGGVNSHMSIRCYEQNIPAIIGLGEKKFNYFKNQQKIELNCTEKKISSLI